MSYLRGEGNASERELEALAIYMGHRWAHAALRRVQLLGRELSHADVTAAVLMIDVDLAAASQCRGTRMTGGR